jgi:hypothetical protein
VLLLTRKPDHRLSQILSICLHVPNEEPVPVDDPLAVALWAISLRLPFVRQKLFHARLGEKPAFVVTSALARLPTDLLLFSFLGLRLLLPHLALIMGVLPLFLRFLTAAAAGIRGFDHALAFAWHRGLL